MESHTESASVATRPLAPYIGGKRALSKRVIAMITATPHDLYAEAFVGMGGIFLRRPIPAKVEVINDLSGDVANFFRILQRHELAFLDMLRWQLTSREHFTRLINTPPDTQTDLERAARFLYVQRLAFGGKVNGRSFGVTRTTPARFDVTKLVPLLQEVHERLAGVTIERLHFAEFIRRYDRPGALFYLDPPYFGCETDYGKDLFDRLDFGQLAQLLAGIKGTFIMSLNDVAEVRRIFASFSIKAVDVRYTIAGPSASKEFGEVIITPHSSVTGGS
jgi:DNA adenine methylase